MSGSLRSPRSYRVFIALTIAGVALPGAASAALLPEAVYSFAIHYVGAIHYPTGCAAMLEYDGSTLLGASITDPLCLPHGVVARPVPAFEHDFEVPGKGWGVFTTP